MAVAAKAKAPASDTFMSAGEMKPLLALSKREPVQAAVGITADGEGVILLHKRLKPKKLLATLKAEASKAKIQLQTATLRFGKAEVDTDYDPGMVRFFLNKEAPGNMRIKLVEVVKRIPYQKVELNVDASFEDEPEDEAESQETTADGASGDPLQAAFEERMAVLEPQLLAALRANRGDTSKMRAVSAFAQEKGAGGDYKAAMLALDNLEKLLLAAAPTLDKAAVEKELAALARRIPEVPDTERAVKAELIQLATDANVNIKTNNLNMAAEIIAKLREGLRDALDAAGVGVGAVVQPAGANAGAGSAGPVVYAKSRLAWLAVRKKIETDVDTLRKEIVDFFGADSIVGDVVARFDEKVKPVLDKLDVRLADALDDAINADPTKLPKFVTDARNIIKEYQDTLASEKIIDDLDANPFVPMAIKQTVTATLATLSKAVH